MNLSDIRNQVNVDVDDQFNSGDIDNWVNRCLDDLTPIAKKQAKTTFTIDSANAYTLPTNFHDFAYILVKHGGGTYKYKMLQPWEEDNIGYTFWDDTIALLNGPDSGTIDLYYYRKLTHLVNPNDVPEIEESFHDMLILYASAKSQYADEEPEDMQIAMNEYLNRKFEYQKYIARKNRTGRVKNVYGRGSRYGY